MKIVFVYLDYPQKHQQTIRVSGSADLPVGIGSVRAYVAADAQITRRLKMVNRSFDCAVGVEDIAADILLEAPDMVAFSCYIWNLDRTLSVCHWIKSHAPSVRVVMGGPDIPCDQDLACEFMASHECVDVVVRGEGEETFRDIVRACLAGANLVNVDGIAFREDGHVVATVARPPLRDLSRLPSPYLSGDIQVASRGTGVITIETARGCPFSCHYCAVYPSRGNVRAMFPLERLRAELEYLKSKEFLGKVLIADSALNFNRKHAVEVLSLLSQYKFFYILDLSAEFFDDGLIGIMALCAPSYLSVGIQTTNLRALRNMARPFNAGRSAGNIEKLINRTAMDIRTDIILGLPGDDFAGFTRTLNWVLSLKPAPKLMLFDLVLLKNSFLWREISHFGIRTNERRIVTSNYTFSEVELLRASRLALAYNWMLADGSLPLFHSVLEYRDVHPARLLEYVSDEMRHAGLIGDSRVWLDIAPPLRLKDFFAGTLSRFPRRTLSRKSKGCAGAEDTVR